MSTACLWKRPLRYSRISASRAAGTWTNLKAGRHAGPITAWCSFPKYINAFMSLKVEQYVDLDTHGMFICTVTEAACHERCGDHDLYVLPEECEAEAWRQTAKRALSARSADTFMRETPFPTTISVPYASMERRILSPSGKYQVFLAIWKNRGMIIPCTSDVPGPHRKAEP